MKKGQVQSGESITVVIIVMILLIIGLVYLSNFRDAQSRDLLEDEQELDLLSTNLRVVNMEEFRCTTDVSTFSDKCFDLLKVQAFNQTLKDHQYYRQRIDRANLTLVIYDDLNTTLNKKRINFYDNLDENVTTQSTFYPINVFDPLTGSKNFAVLEVMVQ